MADLKHVAGLDQFKAALEQLPKNIARNVLRQAVAAGANKIHLQAVDLAPEYEGDDPRPDKGLIKRAIYHKQIPELSSELVQTYFVGVRRGSKTPVKMKGQKVIVDAYYWTWLEFGHYYQPPNTLARGKGSTAKNREIRAALRAGGGAIWVEPRSFMRPAFALAKDAALKAITDYFERNIPREAAKLGLVMK